MAVLTLPKAQESAEGFFIMGTVDGTIKKTEIKAYANVRKNGIIAINLASGNKLSWVRPSTGNDVVMMITAKAQAILFKETDVRATGRSASGVRGMKLRPDDQVVAMNVLTNEQLKTANVLVVFENGFGKRSALTHFDIQNRGGMGIKAAAVTPRVGSVVFAAITDDKEKYELMLASSKGTIIKTPLSSVKLLGRVTQGVTLMRMNAGDKVASAALLGEKEDKEETN
jgi:DNA gyrase subunit A